jgi:hypothetical protein
MIEFTVQLSAIENLLKNVNLSSRFFSLRSSIILGVK